MSEQPQPQPQPQPPVPGIEPAPDEIFAPRPDDAGEDDEDA